MFNRRKQRFLSHDINFFFRLFNRLRDTRRVCHGVDQHRARAFSRFRVDTCRHNRDTHLAFHVRIERRTESDTGIRVNFFTDTVGSFINFQQRQIRPTGDVDQHAAGTLHGGVIKQRVAKRLLGTFAGAVFAFGFTGAHHRLAHLAHHGADVSKVEVNQARTNHQIGHTTNPGLQHFVSHEEGIGEGGLVVRNPEQVLVGNDDQGIDILGQFINAAVSKLHAVSAFKMERLGHHADRQDALFAGGPCDHRCGTRSRTTAHTGGDEDHV